MTLAIFPTNTPETRPELAWDEMTRDELIVRNLPLVTFVVSRMSDRTASGTIDREDAIAYGVEGLIQAIDSYDSSRGVTFASFAVRRIRGAVLDAVRKADLLPRSLRRSSREVESATLALAHQIGRWPSVDEVSAATSIAVEELQSILDRVAVRTVSLEKMMDDSTTDSSGTWEAEDPDEFSDPAACTDRRAVHDLLRDALRYLNERDRRIVDMRYIKNMSFGEIGESLGLSESRICQLHRRLLSSLHNRMAEEMGLAA
jgi:RNA polymerase sigma factor for flagellar operon FliA